MIKRVALLSALALGIASAASALPITYTHSGFGSGTLDGVAFGSVAPVAFTITAHGDTDNRENAMAGPFLVAYFIDNDDASIEIEGVGTFNFTDPTRFFSNVENGLVGFSRAGLFGADLFNGPTAGGWDMTTSIGPLSGPGKVWWDGNVSTDGGELVFNRADSDATFEAVVGGDPVPEPASLLLVGTGIAMAVRRRARRA
jgi:hypothetical protein